MTDQTIHDVTDDDRRLADKVWAILAKRDLWAIDMITEIEAILPPPPPPTPPTLADTPPEERAAYQWMQADVADHDTRYVIANPHGRHGEATLIASDGKIDWILPEYVTPRPDLPRMEWPGTGQDGEEATKVDYVSVAGGRTAYGPWTVARLRKKADTVPPNTLAVGTVIESADDPRIDALPVGSILLDRDEEATTKGRGEWTGEGYIPIPSEGSEFGPWTVLHIPKEKA